MKYIITPTRKALGEVVVPGDKSISHRAIMLASIAEGDSYIHGFLEGQDCLATLKAFERMGVTTRRKKPGQLLITGVGRNGLHEPGDVLDLGNSGTSMRLLMGLLCAQEFPLTMVGDKSLMSRPMRRVCDPLVQMGANIDTSPDGTPPVQLWPVKKLNGIRYEMPVASAQVKSAVLLAGLSAMGDTRIIESIPTRDHTERMLRTLGYPIEFEPGRVSISGGHSLHGTEIHIPADISSAAFFIVAACIAEVGEVTMHNVGMNPTRTGVLEILREMNADFEVHSSAMMGGEPVASITARASQLQGIDVPPALVPSAIDEFPILCIAAACAQGTTRITEAKELRVKESDRIAQVARGLHALNIDVDEFEDGLTIKGGEISGGDIESSGDHRIAMAFSVAAFRAHDEIRINECENVATSFPGFVESARSVGMQVDVLFE